MKKTIIYILAALILTMTIGIIMNYISTQKSFRIIEAIESERQAIPVVSTEQKIYRTNQTQENPKKSGTIVDKELTNIKTKQ